MPDSLRIAPGGGAACVVETTSLPTRDGWSLVGGIEDLCPQCSGNLVFKDRARHEASSGFNPTRTSRETDHRRALRSVAVPSLGGRGLLAPPFSPSTFFFTPVSFSGAGPSWRVALRFGPSFQGRRLLSPPFSPSTFFFAPDSFFSGRASPR